ncbi:MAG: potassium-transporting ATPase subunit F [Lysobacterales bacterium 69-70]|nr:K(+)-transporting ATPase subunit F [Xanthomonadaceae bacterium]ODU32219.1 MAG: potassium-transporting ATPase subunit F [Xanthomonadaceae bacterium SCN 69-320]ODV21505.1 MAG: potassium-transporting ATPase subunit F [Xanthomonadaceae bacterium SCN 69-25]OJZ01943.1 MAG: potassium-transporting ATPase subunit F [Xanthomonadales bacterium 69-70]
MFNLFLLLLSFALGAYLLVALLRPDKF